MGSILSFLGGWQGYLIGGLLIALAAGTGTGYVVHRMDEATIQQMKAQDATAAQVATAAALVQQQKIESGNEARAVAEANAQQQIVTQVKTVVREVETHVPDIRACVPYGLVRVLNDAALGTDTANQPAPAGQSDDACAPVPWRSLAADVADDYGTGRQNSQQLNDLIGAVTANAAIVQQAEPTPH